MFRRLILTLTLAFLFGLSQQGVIAHQISHLDDLAPLSQQQDQTAHSVCDQCLSHSGLAYALGVDHFAFALSKTGFEQTGYQVADHSRLTPSSYQARAPPQFI